MKKEEIHNKIKDYIKTRTTPIFEKALNEKPKKRMSVGGRFGSRVDVSLYQPHNYRLYFDFDKVGFVPPKPMVEGRLGSVDVTEWEYKIKNSTEHFFKNFFDCNITIKKNQVEVVNKVDYKRWYVIKHKEVGDYEVQVKEILEKKDRECVEVLKKFISVFGGKSEFVILNRRSEDKIKLEDSIDRVGVKNQFHSGTAKKVYNDENVEFNDPVFAVNYFENRAIEKVTPEVLREFNKLYNLVDSRLDGLTFLKKNVFFLDDLFKYRDVVVNLNSDDKHVLEGWIMNKFSIGGING